MSWLHTREKCREKKERKDYGEPSPCCEVRVDDVPGVLYLGIGVLSSMGPVMESTVDLNEEEIESGNEMTSRETETGYGQSECHHLAFHRLRPRWLSTQISYCFNSGMGLGNSPTGYHSSITRNGHRHLACAGSWRSSRRS